VTQNASILQEHIHFLRTQLQTEQNCQVLRTRDHLLLHQVVELGAEVIIESVEIGLFLRRHDRFAIRVFGRKHRGKF
jgi:hypothetical protein